MAKRRGRKSLPHHRYKEFQGVAEHFYNAARDSMGLEYWTAVRQRRILIVHSAIAYTDSLCIKLAGVRSIGEDHEEAVTLVQNVVGETEE